MERRFRNGQASPPEASAGWLALRTAAWEDARAHFEADLARGESASALEGLSWAAWWVDDGDTVLDARERAYRVFQQAGDRRGAARMAVWLASDVLDFRGEPAVSAGWLRRAHRLLDNEPRCAEHGWLAVHEGTIALDLEGDTTTARSLGQQCAEIGRALGVLDLEMLGVSLEGQAAVHEGDVVAGMRALDEAAVAAVAGELVELVSVGWSCCSLIKACEQVRDHDRAAQWSQQTVAFAQRVRFDPWFGICRAFYASVLVWRGMWEDAERELLEARDRLTATRPPWAAEAAVRLAELRVCQGRFAEAEELFTEVEFHPRAQLGLGAIALHRGDVATAVRLGERVLRSLPHRERTGRVPALEILVRARVSAHDCDAARATLEELAELVAAFPTAPLKASLEWLRGLVACCDGDDAAGRAHLEDAIDAFARCGAPFDAARARLDLARPLVALEDCAGAEREARAAVDAFSALGAAYDRGRADAILEELRAGGPVQPGERPPVTPREVEVLRLIADGLSDKEMAGKLRLSEHTVHRHVSNILTKLGAPSRAAAVATAAKRNLI